MFVILSALFIRTKKAARNERTYVQLVESYRENGKMKQRVIRHVGTADTPEKLERLKSLAVAIKMELEASASLNTKITDPVYTKNVNLKKPVTKSMPIDLLQAQASAQLILGIHDVYGAVYDIVGFTNPFSCRNQRFKSAEVLKEMVLARIANPSSKRASVEFLGEQFGVQINLDHVYQMMDKIDDLFCTRIQKSALNTAINLTGEKLNILFYDATTLYFESFTEDDLKQNGYSKDMKFNQPQVLLALFVTEKGLPVGYEVFPGKTFEGHTLIPVLEKLKKQYNLKEVIFVADRGMLSKNNLDYLHKNNFRYIVGCRIKALKKTQQAIILEWANSLNKEKIKDEITHQIDLDHGQKLILSYRPSRAKKDKMDRERSIQRLQARLAKSKNPKQLISNYGFQKFITVSGDAQLKIDENKLKSELVWDGLVGICSNHSELNNEQVINQYRGLWQVEESFRITKHDLRVRPIYHWTPKRVKAHIAISFMAFVCVRYLQYRVATQHKKISPEEIRKNLMRMQATVIHDKQKNKNYLLPSENTPITKQIYRVLGIKLPGGVMEIKSPI